VRLYDYFARRARNDGDLADLDAVLELPPHRVALVQPPAGDGRDGDRVVGAVAWADVVRLLEFEDSATLRPTFGPRFGPLEGSSEMHGEVADHRRAALAKRLAHSRPSSGDSGGGGTNKRLADTLVKWFHWHFAPRVLEWMRALDPRRPRAFGADAAGPEPRPDWQEWWMYELAHPIAFAKEDGGGGSCDGAFRVALSQAVMAAAIVGRRAYVDEIFSVVRSKDYLAPRDALRPGERGRLFNKLVAVVMQEYELKNPRSTSMPSRADRYAALKREKEAVVVAYRELCGQRYDPPW